MPTPRAYSGPTRENGKVRIALVLTFGSLCLAGTTSILGVIFGVVALREIDASGGAQTGRAKAITAVVCGAIIFLFCLPLWFGGD